MDKPPTDGDDSDDGAGCNERYEGVPCDGDQFIWDYEALKEENRNRESKEEIPIVLRLKDDDRKVPFGIRAHPDMNGSMCMWSLLVPPPRPMARRVACNVDLPDIFHILLD